MCGKAQRVARPAQTRLQNAGVIGPKFTRFLSHVERSFQWCCVNSRINVAILSCACVVECQRTE